MDASFLLRLDSMKRMDGSTKVERREGMYYSQQTSQPANQPASQRAIIINQRMERKKERGKGTNEKKEIPLPIAFS